MVQVIHEHDVVEAIVLRAHARRARHLQRRRPGRGAALDHPARARRADRCRSRTRSRKPLLTALWRGSSRSFPVPELDHIRYVCMVDGGRAARQLGFRAASTLKETIRAVDADQAPIRNAHRTRSCEASSRLPTFR